MDAPVGSEAWGSDVERHAERLRQDGFVVLKHVLAPEAVADLNALADRLIAARPGEEAYNFNYVAESEPLVAEVAETPLPLAIIVNRLGYNLGLNSSLLSIRPPVAADNLPRPGEVRKMGVGRMVNLGWHRDGPSPQFPRITTFSCKVGFILSDMSRPGRGNTKLIPGSHLRCDLHPDGDPERDRRAPSRCWGPPATPSSST